jgi:serine/threonine protein kinase
VSLKHWRCGEYANQSERRAAEYLTARLQGAAPNVEWVLLTNYASSAGSQHLADDIDMVVVSSLGVSAVEIKHWGAADLKGDRLFTAEHEANKINEKARRLKGKISKACHFDFGFVEGKFLFTKNEGEKFAEGGSRRRVSGVEVFGLSEWRDLFETYRQPFLTKEQVAAICKALHPVATDVALGQPRTFENFFDMKPVEEMGSGFHRVFRARRKFSRDKVLLHLYDLSALPEKNSLEIALREFEVLQRLQKSPWLPSIMDSFQEAKSYPGELYFFSYVDSEAPALAERAGDGEWKMAARFYTTLRSINALHDLHTQGSGDDSQQEVILHRNLTAHSIRVRSNDEPLLTQLHLAKIPSAQTVSAAVPPEFFSGREPFIAPEVLRDGVGAASVASDTYGLCASLRLLFENIPAAADDERAFASQVLGVLERGMAEDPSSRPGLLELRDALMNFVSVTRPAPSDEPPPVQFWDENTVVEFRDSYYRVSTKLGSGGFGTTFKVMQIDPKTNDDLAGPFVAKVITNKEAGESAARAYAKVRAQTGTHHLAGVLEVTNDWQPDRITALLKWIEGESLIEWAGALPLYFDDLGGGTREEIALEWVRDLCVALAQLHLVGLVHGDVSPRNIIVHGRELTLTDYDLAVKAGEFPLGCQGQYCSSEIAQGLPVDFSDDLFALAATIFHVIFDRLPFLHGGAYRKDLGLSLREEERADWPILSHFLDRATHPDRKKRIPSAMAALWLLDGNVDEVVTEPMVPGVEAPRAEELLQARGDNVVPWLNQLLQSYPGSPKGNAETRGLDSDFARQTYVETPLDAALAADILSRRAQLVILCGNAGDGKTAFLQNLAARLGVKVGSSAQRVWSETLDRGLHLYANLDGSAAYLGRPAHELLDEFFEPFHDGDFPPDVVRLLAINDGPLLAWLGEQEQTPLTSQLRVALSEEKFELLDDRIRFIDLNARSLVGGVTGGAGAVTSDFVERLLAKMLGDEVTWKPCLTCTAQPRCHAWDSVRTLLDADKGPFVRERLVRALRAVHQRGEIHITARSLRAALAYIFFGTDECLDLHAEPGYVPAKYFDRAFDPQSKYRQGDLLAELQRLDPALENHALVDRYLTHEYAQHEPEAGARAPNLRSLRRMAYFEWSADKIASVGRSSDALALARGRYFDLFLKVATGTEDERREICSRLCEGVARLEDLPDEAFADQDSVPLKITPRTPTETAFWVNKPRANFSLQPRRARVVEGLETLHTHVILSYAFNNGHVEELIIGAELFNSLMELREGFQISDAQSDDIFANLSIFKQRLAQEDDTMLYAWNPAGDGVIRLEARVVDGVKRLTAETVSWGSVS